MIHFGELDFLTASVKIIARMTHIAFSNVSDASDDLELNARKNAAQAAVSSSGEQKLTGQKLTGQKTALLTSFAPWRANHVSNSADDVLIHVQQQWSEAPVQMLRQLPVNFPIAQSITVHKIKQLQPDVVLCCGMAEFRHRLSLEAQAVNGAHQLHTPIDLDRLVNGLVHTEISYDAGRFVCNALYYGILKHLKYYSPNTLCLFVHVPVLTLKNQESIIADFCKILERLTI
jgi:pyroglutamyl-peptidase